MRFGYNNIPTTEKKQISTDSFLMLTTKKKLPGLDVPESLNLYNLEPVGLRRVSTFGVVKTYDQIVPRFDRRVVAAFHIAADIKNIGQVAILRNY